MKYFLGLDVGGTTTACVLADERSVLGRAQSGSAKILRVTEAHAEVNLRQALDAVSKESGVALADVAASCIGTSGATVPEVKDWLRQQMKMRVGGSLILLGDEVIALDAAFPGEPGVLVIAGTGSNVIGRGRNGWTTSAGGWGPALADEGSGSLLGQQALRNVFSAINAGDEPLLLRRVLDHLKLRTTDELVAVANVLGFPFASLMPVVVQAAREGDSVAQETLRCGGQDLAALVRHVIDRLKKAEPDIEDGLKIACAGSVLRHVDEVRDAMTLALLSAYAQIEFIPGTVDPLDGALWHARRA